MRGYGGVSLAGAAASRGSSKSGESKQKILSSDAQIDLNNAPLDDLLSLPGLNLASAERVIEERQTRLGFQVIEEVGDLLKLPPHKVQRLRERASLTPYSGSGLAGSARRRAIDFEFTTEVQMAKQIKIQIFPDGRIQAEVAGVKGKKCTDYIRILEEMLDAEAVDSSYTPEYYQTEEVHLEEIEQQQLRSQQGK